jgi:hypothetical protein
MKSSVFDYITPCSLVKVTGVSEQYVAYIFRAQESAKQESIIKQAEAVSATFFRKYGFCLLKLKKEIKNY